MPEGSGITREGMKIMLRFLGSLLLSGAMRRVWGKFPLVFIAYQGWKWYRHRQVAR
ncbi:MAG: hypothetical protein H7Z41_06280 [Cytophagales bacterium]|nr:hypothetical protein [Armatimonadota bacterium]